MEVAVSIENVGAALTRIRVAAEQYMDERDAAGLGWVEDAVTDIAIHKGLPAVQVVQFNRRQEGGGVGADYLWWWLDSETDECFGMLVQAKRLKNADGYWTLDISHRGGRQLGDLRRTANHFEVPAMFAVYTGGKIFRGPLRCFHGNPPACRMCERMAILIIGAYQLWIGWESPIDTASEALHAGIPLEDLVDPALPAGMVWDVNLHDMASGPLRQFLCQDQVGPREIAKRIFAEVAKQRLGAFSAALADRMPLVSEAIFPDVPRDRGHYPSPYFEHFLRGLRTAPPAYVHDVLGGRPVADSLANRVDGVILVHL